MYVILKLLSSFLLKHTMCPRYSYSPLTLHIVLYFTIFMPQHALHYDFQAVKNNCAYDIQLHDSLDIIAKSQVGPGNE